MRTTYSPNHFVWPLVILFSSLLSSLTSSAQVDTVAPSAFVAAQLTPTNAVFDNNRSLHIVLQSPTDLKKVTLQDKDQTTRHDPFPPDDTHVLGGRYYYSFTVESSNTNVSTNLITLFILDDKGKRIGQLQIKTAGAAEPANPAPEAPKETFVFVPNSFFYAISDFTCSPANPEKCEDKSRCRDVVVIDACCCPPVLYYPYAESYGAAKLDADCRLKPGFTRKVTAGKEIDFVVQNLNPYKYDVNITSKDSIYFQTNNPILSAAFSTGAISSLLSGATKATGAAPGAIPDHDQHIIDRLKAMNAQLSAYIAFKQTSVDCADMATLKAEKNTILGNIDAIFRAYDPTYANDLNGYVLAQLAGILAAKSDAADQITAALTTYNKLRGYSFDYTYKVLEVPNFDVLTFSLTFSPKKDVPGPALNVTGQNVKLSIVGGWRVNASAGLFTTFGSLFHSAGVYTQNFAFSDSVAKTSGGAADSIYSRKLVKERTTPDIGVGAFVHFYRKSSTFFNWGGSIGAGLTIASSPQLRYFIGPTALIGNTTRMVVTAGLAFGMVNQLSERYRAQYPYVNASESSVQYNSTLGAGFFIAVTYNLPFVQ